MHGKSHLEKSRIHVELGDLEEILINSIILTKEEIFDETYW
jgi:hypothetical protein